MNHAGLYTSDSPEWVTPMSLFKELDKRFGPFTLDPCATPRSAKCKTYFTIQDDGLAQSWTGHRVFMNPPYGRAVRHWIAKAAYEAERGAFVLALIPARTDTAWFHDYVMKGNYEFIRGRIMFERHDGTSGRAPFPSALWWPKRGLE